ncbi:MAG: beta-N-acetylhexosaminidase [Nitrospinae bacterium]|nr:beta-N-acetylhexosaminidase [Nitrospinota bacterium]
MGKKKGMPRGFDVRAAVGQMVIISFPGDGWNPALESLIRDRKVGGFIHFKENIPSSLAALKKLNARILNEGKNACGGLVPFISVDEEGGRVSRLKTLIGEHPAQMDVAQKGIKAVAKNYAALGRKVKRAGFNLTWAPVLDVHTNPANPVIGNRSFSTDAETCAQLGVVAIRELRKAGLFTSGKHFPGHGDTPVDSHLALPVMSTPMKTLNGRELVPFRAAIKAKADFFMTAHIRFDKVDAKLPVSFSKKFLTATLRRKLGYKGLIVTDDLNMNAAKNEFSMRDRIRLAVNAGADVLLIREPYPAVLDFLETFETLVREGEISAARVEESLSRIKRIKRRLSK